MQTNEIISMSDAELHTMYEQDFNKTMQSQILAKSVIDEASIPETLRALAMRGARTHRSVPRFRIVK